jgi:hypothetical protein
VKFPDDQFTDPNLVTKDKRFMLPEGTSAKQALEMVYPGEIVLSPQQMRAAIECLQFEVPKVSAVAVTHMNGQDFASALERAIERSGINPKPLPPPKVIEHEPPVSAEEMKRPFTRLRRF